MCGARALRRTFAGCRWQATSLLRHSLAPQPSTLLQASPPGIARLRAGAIPTRRAPPCTAVDAAAAVRRYASGKASDRDDDGTGASSAIRSEDKVAQISRRMEKARPIPRANLVDPGPVANPPWPSGGSPGVVLTRVVLCRPA